MKKIHFDKHRCKGCGMCVLFCPQKTLRLSEGLNELGFSYPEMIDEEICTTCGLCFRMCPDTAIEVHKSDTQKTQESKK